MNTVIFRTIAPAIVVVMLVFSIFVLLRGHNEPGGGFIGGLIAASAITIFGMASGAKHVRWALVFDPLIHLPKAWGASVLSLAILAIGMLSHITAIQRFIRARALILRQTRN